MEMAHRWKAVCLFALVLLAICHGESMIQAVEEDTLSQHKPWVGDHDDLGESSGVSTESAVSKAAQTSGTGHSGSVRAASGTYLCYLAGQSKVAKRLETTSIDHVACDAHARCDSSIPACTCSEGYKGDGGSCEMVDCGQPAAVPNGKAKVSDTSWKSVASYTCDTGFVLQGASSRQCMSTGKWSNDSPVCNPVECGKRQAPPNTEVKCTGYHFKDTCTQSCAKGYVPGVAGSSQESLVQGLQAKQVQHVKTGQSESLVRQCQADGRWSLFDLSCKSVECPRKGAPENGITTCPGGVGYQSTCVTKCNKGYHLQGGNGQTEVSRTCLASGQWNNPSEPHCELDVCPNLETPANTKVSCNQRKKTFGAQCVFQCDVGYDGSATRNCTAGGKWSGQPPTCKIKDCGNLPQISNGELSASAGTTYEQKAAYICNMGYYMSGSSVRQCRADGKWSGSTPTCTIRDCGNRADINDGKKTCSGTTYGKSCQFTCSEGHDLVGPKELKCGPDGKWSDLKDPKCVVRDCGGLDSPLNAFKRCEQTTYGKKCYFACDQGYSLNGKQSRVCGASGKWSDEQPKCVIQDCGKVGTLEDGTISCTGTTFGAQCHGKCNVGHSVSGDAVRNCRVPASTGTPTPIPGFPEGIPWYQKTASWSGEALSCTIKSCGPQPEITDGKSTCISTQYGGTCKNTCNEGYTQSGSSTRKCDQDGNWDGTETKCNPIYCNKLQDFVNGTKKCTGTTFKKTCEFKCDNGHKLLGSAVRTCQKDGVWSGYSTSCAPNECGKPQSPVNGKMHCTGYTVGKECTFECNSGHDSCTSAVANADCSGNQQMRTCKATKVDGRDEMKWTGKPVLCNPKKCGPLPDITSGTMSCEGSVFNDKCSFACVSGYAFTGSAERVCDVNGQWTGKPGQCEKITCAKYTAPQNADGRCNGDRFGDECTYTCKAGFKASGDSTQKCQAEKSWSGDKLVCTPKDCGKLEPADQTMQMQCTGTQYGHTCTFGCPAGYDLVSGQSQLLKNTQHTADGKWTGGLTRTCSTDGSWSHSMPSCRIKDCGGLAVDNGIVDCPDGNKFSKKCSVKCAEGYTLGGASSHTCGNNGAWGGEKSTCTIVTCPVLKDPVNGVLRDCNKNTFKEDCHIKCHAGYEAVGSTFRTCLASAQWSGAEATCRQIVCPAVPAPENAIATCPQGSAWNQECFFSCVKGYQMDNGEASFSRKCTSDKTWDGSVHKCVVKNCGSLSEPPDGGMTCSGTSYDSKCHFTCSAGFKLQGSSSRVCKSDAAWSGTHTSCTRKDCGPLDGIENGVRDTNEGTQFGASAYFACGLGYKLVGEAARKCGANGLWSGSSPSCEKIHCTPPGAPADGTVECADNAYAKECLFKCNEGHEREGSARRVCKDDGKWTGTETYCKVKDCGGLESPEHGSSTCEATTFGKQCKFHCNLGYTLEGPKARTCGPNGAWTGSTAKCVVKSCGSIGEPENSIQRCTGTTYGSKCEATCLTGYTFCGSRMRKCDASGSWTGDPAECKIKDCGNLKPPSNGAISFTSGTTYESRASMSCNNGYTHVGSSTRTCRSCGSWDGTAATCVVKNCGPLADLADGKNTCTGTTYGNTCKATCTSAGHELAGPETRTCGSAGKWDGTAPSCREKNCGVPALPEHGEKQCEGTTFGKKCTFKCSAGYQVSAGDSTRECQASKLWSGTALQCKIKDCGPLADVSNGIKTCSKSTFGGHCQFKCENGYELVGSELRNCNADGSWTGSKASCRKKGCGNLKTPANARIVAGCTGTTYGHTCEQTCEPGYDTSGDEIRSCLGSGAWSGNNLKCTIRDCGQPECNAKGKRVIDRTTFGGKVTYSCEPGYLLKGVSTRECRADGKWGGVTPECAIVACPLRTPPQNGMVKCNSAGNPTFGATCEFSCSAGYLFSWDKAATGKNGGHHKITECTASGSWDVPHDPTCEPMPCQKLGSLLNGNAVCKNSGGGPLYTYGTECVNTCNDGYALVGDSQRKCDLHGKWCGAHASCKIKSCGMPDRPTVTGPSIHADMSCSGTSYTDTCTFTCPEGYDVNGQAGTKQQARNCQDQVGSNQGKWSGSAMICVPRDCGSLTNPGQGITVSCQGTTFGKVCTFGCGHGLRLNGPSQRKCIARGTGQEWSGQQPTCVGLRYDTAIALKTQYASYITAKPNQCQTQATADCKCENFNIKKKDWGMNSECCGQPVQDKKGGPWCFCESGPRWAMCDSKHKPKPSLDHDETGLSQTSRFSAQPKDQKSGFMQYGDWVHLYSEPNRKFLSAQSSEHITLVDDKDKTSWQLVNPTQHGYRGYIPQNGQIAVMSDKGRYMHAAKRNAVQETIQKPYYEQGCEKSGPDVLKPVFKADQCCRREPAGCKITSELLEDMDQSFLQYPKDLTDLGATSRSLLTTDGTWDVQDMDPAAEEDPDIQQDDAGDDPSADDDIIQAMSNTPDLGESEVPGFKTETETNLSVTRRRRRRALPGEVESAESTPAVKPVAAAGPPAVDSFTRRRRRRALPGEVLTRRRRRRALSTEVKEIPQPQQLQQTVPPMVPKVQQQVETGTTMKPKQPQQVASPPPPTGCVGVSLYQDGSYGGWKRNFKPGTYAGSGFSAQGTSSLKVPAGCVAYLSGNGRRRTAGWTAKFISGDYDLTQIKEKGAVEANSSGIKVVDTSIIQQQQGPSCKCIANDKCPNGQAYTPGECLKEYEAPGKFIRYQAGTTQMIGCNADGKHCVTADRAEVGPAETFTVIA